MTDIDRSVFTENRDHLIKLKNDYSLMSDGAAFQFAEALDRIDGTVDPATALQFFSDAAGGNEDMTSFAGVCKFLTLPADSTDEESEPPGSAVYFRTPVSDKAYSLFSEEYKGLGAMYAADFKTVCEDVYYDRADACILPLESSEDGLIMSFRHLMLKYELTITSVVSIDVGEDKFQTMALLTNGNVDRDGDVCEICLTAVRPQVLADFTEAIRHFDARPIRVTSVPSKARDKYDHHICISVPPVNVPRLRFFTDGVFPANVFLGQYKTKN
ncbi:MAG: hypothetical protein IJO81_04585 [Clostridia bacterium]|nr:hypothetical protein [Clostridia bacterium]